MRIQLIVAALPPRVDGIGDYTANLAVELSRAGEISILTGSKEQWTSIPGVSVAPVFSPSRPSSVLACAPAVESFAPDWLILQYNPFNFGRWGFNPYLVGLMRAVRKRCPGTRIGFMVHEPFVPATTPKLAIMTSWQRWQLWTIGRASDLVLFSIEKWQQRFSRWLPGRRVEHLPVGSNIPWEGIARADARGRLNLAEETLSLGLFGTARSGRVLHLVSEAVEQLRRTGREVALLYVGPHGEAIARELPEVPLLDCGLLSASEVSHRFAAMDAYLAPFVDGVSSRRTNVMTALQHGVPVVGTHGPLSDSLLLRENGHSLLLADASSANGFSECLARLAADSARRAEIGARGRELFQREFSWERIGRKLLRELGGSPA